MDSLVYWEERTINIGDYESVKCGLNYSSKVKKINEKENTITISEMDTRKLTDDKGEFEATVKLMTKRVRAVLNSREADLRMKAEQYVEGNSPTKKALVFGIIDAVLFRKKYAKLELSEKEANKVINEVEDGDESNFDHE